MSNRVVLNLCLALLLVAGLVSWACAAEGTVNGVLAQERVVALPQDQGKWYVSVVGDYNDARYGQVLGWFDSNENLKKLKDQVQFCPVVSGGSIYRERYAANIKGLPTVRVQDSKGKIIWEGVGNEIPMTAEGLYGAIAGGVAKASGLAEACPWRRKNSPSPSPTPPPTPDPAPQPIDDGGAPEVVDNTDSTVSGLVLGVLITGILACGLFGVGAGVAVQWKQAHPKA